DHTCTVGSRDHRILQPRVLPELDPDVAVVERRGVQPDQHLVRARGRVGHGTNLELMGSKQLDGTHGLVGKGRGNKERKPTSASGGPTWCATVTGLDCAGRLRCYFAPTC